MAQTNDHQDNKSKESYRKMAIMLSRKNKALKLNAAGRSSWRNLLEVTSREYINTQPYERVIGK